jgi:hypothetical protein
MFLFSWGLNKKPNTESAVGLILIFCEKLEKLDSVQFMLTIYNLSKKVRND